MNSTERFPRKWPALGIVLLSILLPFFFASLFITSEDDLLSGKLRTLIIIGELFVIIPSLIYIHRKEFPLRSVYRIRNIDRSVGLWGLIIGVGISIIGDELDRLISIFFTPPEWLTQSLEFFRISNGLDFLILIGGVAVIAPLTEELLFRGFLQTTLEYREQNVTRAILLTALAFALLHSNIWWIVQIYLFGLVLSYFSWRTQSILPGFFIHMGINATSVLLGNLDLQGKLDWYTLGNHVSPIILALACLGAFYGVQHITDKYPLNSRVSDTILPADIQESDTDGQN